MPARPLQALDSIFSCAVVDAYLNRKFKGIVTEIATSAPGYNSLCPNTKAPLPLTMRGLPSKSIAPAIHARFVPVSMQSEFACKRQLFVLISTNAGSFEIFPIPDGRGYVQE